MDESKGFFSSLVKEKKYRIVFIISIIIAIFIIGGAIAAHYYRKTNNPIIASSSKTPTQSVKKIISPLDGLAYTDDKATRHPLAVSVENHPDARPQSGLSKASVVYEALTEGGITRFLAIFGPQDADEIGPIRSARLFFMDWVKEYDAYFAHAGGNEDALANIDKYQIKNLENSTAYFWRDSKGRSVASEHTLYSSTDKLFQYASSKGYDTTKSDFTPLKFKSDGPAAVSGKGVDINFSTDSYRVRWDYDAVNNQYNRSLAGQPHKDRGGTQITAKNVIVQTVVRTFQPTGSYGSQNYVFTDIGSGKASVLRDGQVIDATWKKESLTSRTIFTDSTGAEIQFNPGATWYEIVPPEVSPSFF
jgi:hypothetical protein